MGVECQCCDQQVVKEQILLQQIRNEDNHTLHNPSQATFTQEEKKRRSYSFLSISNFPFLFLYSLFSSLLQNNVTVFHGPLLYVVIVCGLVGLFVPPLIHMVPDNKWWKVWLPSPILLGVGGLYGGVNFSCLTMLLIAFVYQVHLKKSRPEWHKRFQHVSTSGVNAGVGLSGLLVVLFTYMELPTVTVGPQPIPMNGTSLICTNVSLPAITAEDIACYNLQTTCNTPWPSN
jgi:hypothetical protein